MSSPLRRLLLLTALFSTWLALTCAQPLKRCAPACRFQPCAFGQVIQLGAPNTVQRPPICKIGSNLTDILSVGEASIGPIGGSLTPISEWRPAGLDTPFRKDFFGAARISGFENPGVITKRYKGNQFDVIDDTCVVLPIEKYQIGRLDGSIRTVNSRGLRDCFSFVPRTREIIIELAWVSGDDLDLAIVEPDGTVVNFRNRQSTCGKLLSDSCVDCCGIFGSSRERATYDANCGALQRGKYRAVVSHASNCGLGPTSWALRVIVNGVVVRSKGGISDKDGGKFAGRVKFTL